MSWFDDLLNRLRGTARAAATDAAAASARHAVSSAAESWLSAAESELEEARRARGLDDAADDAPREVPPPTDAPAPTARERREAAEARARDELARLKAERQAAPRSGDDDR